MKKEILVFLLLLLISIPAVRSLFIPGGFTSHDLTHHIVRQISMDKLLSEGQFPPRWSGELNNGWGYPVFLFNYPLPALFGELFHILGFNFLTSVKAVLFSSMILSVLGMYLFLRSYLGSRMAAFLGAMFYLYAPIRFLNVYVSASVGGALALGILPFVFLALNRGNVLAGSILMAFLILSHNVTALIFAPVLLTFGLFLAKKTSKTIIIFLLGLGLSAWFWLPAVWEKQYIIFDAVFKDFYKTQFISLAQILRSPWGFGLSHPQSPQAGDMSYQLGLIHILVMLVYSLWFIVYGRKSKNKIVSFFILGGFILSIFLTNKISQPVWQFLPFMPLIQFPLRFLAIAVFTASIGAALLIKYLPFKKTIFLALLVLVIYANRNHWKINEVFDPGENYYLSLKTTTASFNEHLPKWGRKMPVSASSKLEIIHGSGSIRVIKDQSDFVSAQVESSSSATLRFNQFYFPGWQIQIDNKPVKFNYLIDGVSFGLPVFDIEKGKHQILAQFKNTTDRNLADSISVITVIIIIIIICRSLILR